MATYKYQQNFSEGAGYVQYNITPDFGAVLAPGETFEISGRIYAGSKKCYGVSVETVHIGSSAWYRELAKYAKTISAGKSATFAIGLTVPELDVIETAGRQLLPTYINFGFLMNSDLDVGETTDRYDEQRLSLVKERLTPAVSGVTFMDSAGAYEYFGGAVQGKSDLSAELSVRLDPLDPSLRITHAEFALAQNGVYGSRIYVQEDGISGNTLRIGVPGFSGEFDGYMLTVTDSKGMQGSFFGGAFAIYPYASPRLYAIDGKELAERYEVNTDDAGNETLRQSDSGNYLWANFAADVTPVNGKNRWEIRRSYAAYGMNLPEGTVVKAFADGESIRVYEDQDIFPRSIPFSENTRWTVEIEIRDFFESAKLSFDVEKAGGYFNIEKYGASVGMRSTATAKEPKFESAYPVYPYKGIQLCSDAAYEIPLALDSSGKFKLYDEDPGLQLIVYGNSVHLTGNIAPAVSIDGGTEEHIITTIPDEYAPKYPLTALQQGRGTAIWMLRVYPLTDHDESMRGKAVFSRYRSGASYADAAAGYWLPVCANWICGGTVIQGSDGSVVLSVLADGSAVIYGTDLAVDADGNASMAAEYLNVYADGSAEIG